MPLEARGSELEQPFAFGVVRQLLEPVINRRPSAPICSRAPPVPRRACSSRTSGGRRARDAGFEALHSLYWLVVNLADQAPLLVLVDDCQWVDRDSLRFLAYLAQRIEGLPVAMLLAGRPPDAGDEAGSLWAQVASRPAAVALYPRPLSESAAVALARERLGADAAEEFCRACHTATGGNPLFLRELLTGPRRGGGRAVGRRRERGAGRRAGGGAAASSCTGSPRSARRRPSWRGRSPCSATTASSPLAAGVSGLSEDAAAAAADDLVRADIFVHGRSASASSIRSCARRCTRISRRASARRATRRRPRRWRDAGASPERVTAHLLLTAADRGSAQGRDAQVGRRGAARAAALRARPPRACAGRSPNRPAEQERGGDPDRARPLRGRRDAVRGGRGASARRAGFGRRA